MRLPSPDCLFLGFPLIFISTDILHELAKHIKYVPNFMYHLFDKYSIYYADALEITVRDELLFQYDTLPKYIKDLI